MKVLMSADTVGGVFTYAVDLTAELVARGAEVAVVTFGRRPSSHQRERLVAAGAGEVLETELALEWMADPWRDLAAAERCLLEAERRLAPDVVHLNAYAHGGAPFRAPAVVVGHSCVTSWWRAVHRSDPPASWARYRQLVRRGCSGAGAVVAPSQTMLTELERCYGPLRAPARVIHNGTRLPEAPPSTDREPLVLGSGRLWDEAKNVGALERVAARRALRGRVLLAGEDAETASGGPARRLGLLSSEQISQLRRRVAVYAAPARYEPFGLGILEAARDGCALVLGDIPSLRELWEGAAEFVHPDDEAGLGAALERLLADPTAARRAGRRAQERSRAYPAGAMGEAYLELYEQLTDRAGALAA
jgi:glycogen(starch) synthase